jgi:hypothetical protein
VVRRLVLERDGSSLEGCLGCPLDGPLRLLGPWASFPHRAVIMWGVLYDLWVSLRFVILRKGVFPWSSGTLVAVPDSNP